MSLLMVFWFGIYITVGGLSLLTFKPSNLNQSSSINSPFSQKTSGASVDIAGCTMTLDVRGAWSTSVKLLMPFLSKYLPFVQVLTIRKQLLAANTRKCIQSKTKQYIFMYRCTFDSYFISVLQELACASTSQLNWFSTFPSKFQYRPKGVRGLKIQRLFLI